MFHQYSYPPKYMYVDINTNDIMYILYTSGTTEKPKGTLIRYKGVINLCYTGQEIELNIIKIMKLCSAAYGEKKR